MRVGFMRVLGTVLALAFGGFLVYGFIFHQEPGFWHITLTDIAVFIIVGQLFVITFMYQDIVEKRNYIKRHADPKEVIKKLNE